MKLKSTRYFLSTLALAAASLSSHAGGARTYIVVMDDTPVGTYLATTAGQPAGLAKAAGNATASRALEQSYVSQLRSRRSAALAAVGNPRTLHEFHYAVSGATVVLTEAQARALRRQPGVRTVRADVRRELSTDRTPTFLGLDTKQGVWSLTDASGRPIKGEDIVIGIIDTGAWPEDPSFFDKVDSAGRPSASGQAAYGPAPAGWAGVCQSGDGFTAAQCNNKLIGARYYRAGFDAAAGLQMSPLEFSSPRALNSHGVHTSSTAGGNSNVASGAGAGLFSGIAPRARIAVYKACWQDTLGNGSCLDSDTMAAIDQAVKDGVNIINYSVSGTQTDYNDPVEQAFLGATAAGVFVNASAGNDGGNTVAHMSPWITTVAASTSDKQMLATLSMDNGQAFTARSASTGTPKASLILASAAARFAPFNDTNILARLCAPNSLDPNKAAGRIIVCDRGSVGRVDKAAEVKRAGGIGMVLLNTSPYINDLQVDQTAVPAAHFGMEARQAIRGYAAQPGAAATLSAAVQTPGKVAPVMAGFSSRGPNLADSDILKPDLTAPGVEILAAAVPVLTQAQHDAMVASAPTSTTATAVLQGTSMSGPHVSGAAALLRQMHPSWSPAAIKSALLTSTSGVKLADGSADLDRWGYGAGHLNPGAAATVDWVYDLGAKDYDAFLCGRGALAISSSRCVIAGTVTPANLNLPTLTSDVVGITTLRRTLRNASNSTSTYVATATVPGFSVTVTPPQLTLAPGAQASFDVKLASNGAEPRAWSFGTLVWSNGPKQITSPLSARAFPIKAPAEFADTRVIGSAKLPLQIGVSGGVQARSSGLVAALRSAGTVDTYGQTCFDVNIPAGSPHARFQLFDEDTGTPGKADLNLSIAEMAAFNYYTTSGYGANKVVDIPNPTAGAYQACVMGGSTGLVSFTMSSWVLAPNVSAGPGLTVQIPANAANGSSVDASINWSVGSSARYFGVINYTDSRSAVLGATRISIDPVSVATPAMTRGSASARRVAPTTANKDAL